MKSQKNSYWAFFILILMGPALFLMPPLPALAEDYPTKPITVYCGYAAGATTDLTARGLAAGLEKLLGVAVVVENKAGGGATVAA
ncbi:MAG: tripartite tricarboxylate transporter substrate binding protein BugD, partial [Planctomycetaceae bacterium]